MRKADFQGPREKGGNRNFRHSNFVSFEGDNLKLFLK
jgi:hypothetical protein